MKEFLKTHKKAVILVIAAGVSIAGYHLGLTEEQQQQIVDIIVTLLPQ